MIATKTKMITHGKPVISLSSFELGAQKTGREIDEFMFVLVPLSAVLFKKDINSTLFSLGQWAISRALQDLRMPKTKVPSIQRIGEALNRYGQNGFAGCFTMKMHTIIHHCLRKMEDFGSPALTSAAGFERANQELARNISIYCAKPEAIGKRFIARQRLARMLYAANSRLSSKKLNDMISGVSVVQSSSIREIPPFLADELLNIGIGSLSIGELMKEGHMGEPKSRNVASYVTWTNKQGMNVLEVSNLQLNTMVQSMFV
ncbi:unnamed protein product [Caenorhabditis bovis]|uniref:Uncharacterized protein n=1 Tax=Caenorhabditis bovis TaxID=2654633 RepID=A0A8S1F3V5_9PELO|nr:unnamed protein product [Caenorhabditis bovis]